MSEIQIDLAELQERLGYRFVRIDLFEAALTHSSAFDGVGPRVSERLEFLGDSVVGLVLSEALLQAYPSQPEGQLSRFRAALVNTDSLARKALAIGLDRGLRLGRGEEKQRGREKPTILAAVMESVVAAIFLDAGYEQARAVLRRHFAEEIEGVATRESLDPKTALQEICQAQCHRTPTYHLVATEGPDHARRYWVEARVGDIPLGAGYGTSKRAAEREAAEQALRESRDIIATLPAED